MGVEITIHCLYNNEWTPMQKQVKRRRIYNCCFLLGIDNED